MATEFAHAMRAPELTLAMPLLPAGGCVLELGAGDGWQAHALHEHGFKVTAIDVAAASPETPKHYPVSTYDGRTLPFPDHSFDAIYSSNVLEHIESFEQIQSELARVLRPGGVAVHCVPSATWRLWTTLGHPVYAARWIWRSRIGRPGQMDSYPHGTVSHQTIEGMGTIALLRLGLVAPRHGEHGGLLGEHWLFSRWGWRRRFERTGWRINSMMPSRLFYSGNELMGLHLANGIRRTLSFVLGSSTLIYILYPTPPAD
jgi:SAM-dependent methyltransferase